MIENETIEALVLLVVMAVSFLLGYFSGGKRK